MRVNRPTGRIIAVICALSLTAAACGSDDETPAASDETEAPAPAGTDAAAATDEPAPAGTEPAAELPSGVAGMVVLAPVASLEQAASGFHDATAACATATITVDEQNAEGDIPTVSAILDGFVADQVDFVHAVTTPAAQAAFQIVDAAGGTTPVAYSAVTDPFAAGLATDASTHEVWITGSQSLPPFGAVVDAAIAIVPDAEIIGLPFAPSEANSEAIVNALQAIVTERGLTLETASVADSSEVGQATESLVSRGVDVIIVPTISTVDSGIAAMAQVAADHQIPLVGSAGAQAANGAAIAIGADYYAAGARAGEIACSVISGEGTPADFDVINIEDVEIVVNSAAAEEQGATIPDDLLADAEILE